MVHLFTNLAVGSVEMRNRIVLPPMASGKSTDLGHITDELLEHYAELSEGPGLVIVEHSYVDTGGKLSEDQLGIYSDEHLEGLRDLAETIKSKGAVSGIQINHAGGKCSEDVTGSKVVAPSESYFEDAEHLSIEEMEVIKRKFVEAAERAVKAGFDAVEVHGAHGFLLGQFLSPLTNQRDDGYGRGLEGRMRFPLEIVEGVKEVVGDRLLLYRLGASDMDEEGLTIDESMIFASELERKGVNVIDVSGNLCGSRPDTQEQGYFVPLAEKIKSAVEVPVIGVGGVKDPRFADSLIREERIDLIAVGREQWKDPQWAMRAKEELES